MKLPHPYIILEKKLRKPLNKSKVFYQVDQAKQHTLVMDNPFGAWLPELDIEDLREFVNQHQQTCPYSEFVDSSSLLNLNSYQNLATRDQSINAATIGKPDSCMATATSFIAPIGGSSSSTFTVSFGDFNSSSTINQNKLYGGYNLEYHDATKRKDEMSLNDLLGSIELPKRASNTRRNHRQAKEHIMAERKRREKLTQRFISLAALLPETKKMDKATVLEDASKHIKNLQNRVKELEETISEKNIIHESTTSVSKSKSQGGHEVEASSFDETKTFPSNAASNHGIKVRKSGSNVLVRIYCEVSSPLALKALNQLERLHLTVMCNSILPISGTAALVTIIAQMSEECVMTAKDLVNCLQLSLSDF